MSQSWHQSNKKAKTLLDFQNINGHTGHFRSHLVTLSFSGQIIILSQSGILTTDVITEAFLHFILSHVSFEFAMPLEFYCPSLSNTSFSAVQKQSDVQMLAF